MFQNFCREAEVSQREGRPLLTSPFKVRNKNLSLFGRKSPLERFLSPDNGGTEGGVKTIEDLEGSILCDPSAPLRCNSQVFACKN